MFYRSIIETEAKTSEGQKNLFLTLAMLEPQTEEERYYLMTCIMSANIQESFRAKLLNLFKEDNTCQTPM